jgi:hypothetical protein
LSGDHAQATISSYNCDAGKPLSLNGVAIPKGWCRHVDDRRAQLVTAAPGQMRRCNFIPEVTNFTTAVMLATGPGRPAWTPSGCLVGALAFAVVAIMCGASCPSSLALRIPRQVLEAGGSLVKVLLPQGRGCLELDASGWSGVPLIDAVGSPPYRDFADEGGAWVASRCGPDRLGALLAGVISNLLGEVGH